MIVAFDDGEDDANYVVESVCGNYRGTDAYDALVWCANAFGYDKSNLAYGPDRDFNRKFLT